MIIIDLFVFLSTFCLFVYLFIFATIKRIEIEVQPYVAKILMARSLLESIIPAIVSLFIGPWSDKFGRRPIVLTTFTGIVTITLLQQHYLFIIL